MPKIEYKPTPEMIKLTPELEEIMTQAIAHINEAPTPLKALTRWQFWTRRIYDLGKQDGKPFNAIENLFDRTAVGAPETECRNGRRVNKSSGRDIGDCLECEGTGCES